MTRQPEPAAYWERTIAFARRNPPLFWCAAFLGLAALILGPLAAFPALDPRTVGGAPVWLKPFKFAVSISVYCLSLLWILQFLEGRDALVRRAGWIIAIVMVIETVAIFGQAARGRISHFNNTTALDGVIYNVMGGAIMTAFVVHVIVSVALLRQKASLPAAFRSSLNAALWITALGMAIAFLMTSPTAEQLELLKHGSKPEFIGAHTVGAPDGGPGIFLTGWSATGGDLRIGHFIGLHALQILPLFGWLISRKTLADGAQLRLVRAIGLSYLIFTVAVTVQALRGQPLLQPDAWTLLSFAVGFAPPLLAFVALARSQNRNPIGAN
jgi:hypothetical protein